MLAEMVAARYKYKKLDLNVQMDLFNIKNEVLKFKMFLEKLTNVADVHYFASNRLLFLNWTEFLSY